MTHPFSDTTTATPHLPPEWEQAKQLSERLGIKSENHPGKWTGIMLAAMHTLLDRIEALETKKE